MAIIISIVGTTVLTFTVQDPGGIANVSLDSASSQYLKLLISGPTHSRSCSVVSIGALDREVLIYFYLYLNAFVEDIKFVPEIVCWLYFQEFSSIGVRVTVTGMDGSVV